MVDSGYELSCHDYEDDRNGMRATVRPYTRQRSEAGLSKFGERHVPSVRGSVWV